MPGGHNSFFSKIKKYFLFILIFGLFIFSIVYSLVGAGGSSSKGDITLYVGEESVKFYQKIANEYTDLQHEGNEELGIEKNPSFPKVVVKGADGNYAGQFQQDPENGADIFWIAQDGLSNLTSGAGLIAPFSNPDIKAQLQSDNSKTILDLVTIDKKIYGAPYIGQSMVLYYNKKLISETDVKTWEGIMRAANTKGIKAFTLPDGGKTGYHQSLIFLSSEKVAGRLPRQVLKFYTNLDSRKDDTEPFKITGLESSEFKKIAQFSQNLFTNYFVENTDFSSTMQKEKAIALISGAWHANTMKQAIGESNLGITVLPEFTIDDKTYQSGTWTDVKVFCMKKTSPHLQYLQPLIKYLTSWDVQERSFLEVDNLPSHKDAFSKINALGLSNTDLKFLLAKAQLEMNNYGIPQPFGQTAIIIVNGKSLTLSNCYYEGGATQLWMEYLMSTTTFDLNKILALIKRSWEEGIPVNQ